LANNMPDGSDISWIINNCELVEQQSADYMRTTWYFRMREKT